MLFVRSLCKLLLIHLDVSSYTWFGIWFCLMTLHLDTWIGTRILSFCFLIWDFLHLPLSSCLLHPFRNGNRSGQCLLKCCCPIFIFLHCSFDSQPATLNPTVTETCNFSMWFWTQQYVYTITATFNYSASSRTPTAIPLNMANHLHSFTFYYDKDWNSSCLFLI